MNNVSKFAVFDIDGTLIRWQLYHAIVNYFVKQEVFTSQDAITIKQARMAWKNRNDQDAYKEYEKILVKIFNTYIPSISPSKFNEAAESVTGEYKNQTYVYTRNLLKQLKNEGYFLLAISGSPQELLNKISNQYGFDDSIGALYHQHNGRHTGQVSTPIFDKAKALTTLVKRNNLNYKGSIGVGDTYSDVSMLELIENPIAFNPEQKLFNYAQKNGWKIVVERKNVIYHLAKENSKYTLSLDRFS